MPNIFLIASFWETVILLVVWVPLVLLWLSALLDLFLRRPLSGIARVLWLLLIIFLLIWIVLAVFAFIIGTLFVRNPGAIFSINVQILVALVLGWLVYRRGVRWFAPSIAGYAVLLGAVFAGDAFAAQFPVITTLSVSTWVWILLLYSFAASVPPVWVLLQPRDYLNAHPGQRPSTTQDGATRPRIDAGLLFGVNAQGARHRAYERRPGGAAETPLLGRGVRVC